MKSMELQLWRDKTDCSRVREFKPGRNRCIFSEGKNPEYDFLRSRVVDLRHVKEPQTEIRASEKKLSDFSRSL